MTRDGILLALRQEIDSLTDEDIEALSKHGYSVASVQLERHMGEGTSQSANVNGALHNVEPWRSYAQWQRLQKMRGG